MQPRGYWRLKLLSMQNPSFLPEQFCSLVFCSPTITLGLVPRRRRRGGGAGGGRRRPPLGLPVLSRQIPFAHFIPGWSGVQRAVGCLSTEPEPWVPGGRYQRRCYGFKCRTSQCFSFILNSVTGLSIPPFPGWPQGSGKGWG